MAEKTNVSLYFGEKSRIGFLGTGTTWLGGGKKTSSFTIKASLPGVINWMKKASEDVDYEIKNYSTYLNWFGSFFGEKKSKEELEKFKKELDEVIVYLEEKQKKHPTIIV